MRTPALILIAVAATAMAASAGPQDKGDTPRKDQTEEVAKKIKDLQKERVATLKELVDRASELFKNGRITFDEVHEAKLLFIQAELDAAEKGSERVTLYKSLVDELEKYETFVEAQRTAGRADGVLALKLKARRLEATIHLEQEKAKEAKERK